MNVFTPDGLAQATGGQWRVPVAPATFGGFGTDTRADLHGRVFVALRGERHDGHEHLAAARAGGAVAALVDDDTAPADGLPCLVVDDTRSGLGRAAAAHRQTLTRTAVVAITGSFGKTTTKRMVHALLRPVLSGRAAPRSFNNDIGVPLTLLSARADDDYLVVEVGTNAPGEIAHLARMVEPDIAVLTGIGPAHLEGLGDLAGVAAEKSDLLRFVRAGGRAIVSGDHPELDPHLPDFLDVIRFGTSDGCDLRLTGHGRADGGWLEINGHWRAPCPPPGRHHALDAVAAIAVARTLGVTDDDLRTGLAALPDDVVRVRVHAHNGVRVFDDAYNANPVSMDASLAAFIAETPDARRRVVVLGDMLELGAAAPAYHADLGRRLADLPVDVVVLVGAAMAEAERACVAAGGRCEHRAALPDTDLSSVAARIEPGDAVLLKGSRGLRLERLVPVVTGSD